MRTRFQTVVGLSLLVLLAACCCPPRCPCPSGLAAAPADVANVVEPAESMEPGEPTEPAAPAAAVEPEWPSAEARTMKDGHAPTPYTADQIRVGCPVGRLSKFRMEAEGAPQMIQVMYFVENDVTGAVLEVSVTDAKGNTLSAPKRTPKSPWPVFQSHASFPADQTTISEETIETEGGSFACLLYTVTRSEADPKAVDEYWFAKTLPGPPVLMRKRVDGEILVKMELLSNEMLAPDPK